MSPKGQIPKCKGQHLTGRHRVCKCLFFMVQCFLHLWGSVFTNFQNCTLKMPPGFKLWKLLAVFVLFLFKIQPLEKLLSLQCTFFWQNEYLKAITNVQINGKHLGGIGSTKSMAMQCFLSLKRIECIFQHILFLSLGIILQTNFKFQNSKINH